MRNKTIAMMLALAAAPNVSFAKTQDCPGLECHKRVGSDDSEGTLLLEVDTLFKCHGDPQSFDGAMAGLAGDLNGHARRAFGIVTFGDDGYFAFVKAPYRVSAPVFFVQDETSYACVTVQHHRHSCRAQSNPQEVEVDIEIDVDVEETDDVMPPDNIAEWPSRLLQANFDAADDTQGDDAQDSEQGALPAHAGNIGLREPKAPPVENQPIGLPEAQDMEIEDLPMQEGNIGLREPKAPPIENQPIALPEARDMEIEDLPMQAGNIGLREPQAPPAENQPKDGRDDGERREPGKDKDT